jgi:Reverse transcriptase (RNA-dependent DNA polymerase)
MIQLLQVLDKWTEILDKGGSIDVIYLGLAKAFDTVPHQRLLRKLSNYRVSGKVLEWIRQFLTGRKQQVRIGQGDSNWSKVSSGVPQRSVLCPTQFVCFINDLPDFVKSFIFTYADDTKLLRQVDDVENQKELQQDLNEIVKWKDKWQLGFNIEKCKTMHIGRSVNDELQYTMRHPNVDLRVT